MHRESGAHSVISPRDWGSLDPIGMNDSLEGIVTHHYEFETCPCIGYQNSYIPVNHTINLTIAICFNMAYRV